MWSPLLEVSGTSQNSSQLNIYNGWADTICGIKTVGASGCGEAAWWLPLMSLHQGWHPGTLLCSSSGGVKWYVLTSHWPGGCRLFIPCYRHVGTFFGGLKPIFFAHFFLTLPSSFSHWLLALVYCGLSPACGLLPAVTFFERMGHPCREWWWRFYLLLLLDFWLDIVLCLINHFLFLGSWRYPIILRSFRASLKSLVFLSLVMWNSLHWTQ